MIIAAIQMTSGRDKKMNIQKAEKLINEAAIKGAKVVVLPEMFNFRGTDEEKMLQAETIPGFTINRMVHKAKQYKIYILCGSIAEKSKNYDKPFNTSVLVSPQGDLLAKYRKIHLFDMEVKEKEGKVCYRESAFIQPGREIISIDTELTTFGFSICYDLRFPELYRRLTFKGARVIFLPAAFTLYTGKDHWEPLIRARAIENQIYIIASAQIGFTIPGKPNYGKSMIVDPWGIVIAKASDKEMLIYADIDFSYQNKIREELPCLQHIKNELFTEEIL